MKEINEEKLAKIFGSRIEAEKFFDEWASNPSTNPEDTLAQVNGSLKYGYFIRHQETGNILCNDLKYR